MQCWVQMGSGGGVANAVMTSGPLAFWSLVISSFAQSTCHRSLEQDYNKQTQELEKWLTSNRLLTAVEEQYSGC